MEILHLADEKVAEYHDLLFEKQNSLDARVKAGEAKKKALRKILANTLDPHDEQTPASGMASSMKRTIIKTRLGEVDYPVKEAEHHQQLAQKFGRVYGTQLHKQAKNEM